MAVNGGAARFSRIVVDVSFEDRSRCPQLHDAVAVMFSDRGASQPAERAADMEDEGLSRVSRELSSFCSELGRFLVFTRSWSSSNLREELTSEANLVHNAIKQCWADTYDTGHDEDLLSHLARLLFMKRKRVE